MTKLLGSLLAVVLFAQAPAPAQTDRTVAGTVIDEQGKPIAGATVEMETAADPYLPDKPARADAGVKALSSSNDNYGWIYVVEKLSLDRDERWRKTFLEWAPIFNPANRDVMFDRF
jgi:hypothetical protein